MDTAIYRKKEKLKEYLGKLENVAVAFSGGVDSAFLLAAAREALGDHAFAITADSVFFPEKEREEARCFCESRGIIQLQCPVNVLKIEGVAQNPENRCYLCKKHMFMMLKEKAAEYHIFSIAEGSNLDDTADYRPGLKAVEELGILSPLREVGLKKAEIRELSAEMQLPTWNKPSFACLASRFAYGEELTEEKLAMTEKAEQLLVGYGFGQFRVRVHGRLARIEVPAAESVRLFAPDLRREITDRFREYGFTHISVDLDGYRTGSMNEGMNDTGKNKE